MSYEDEIQAMRDRKVEPAPFERLAEKQAATPQMPPRRLSVAAVATVCAALAFLVLLVRPAIGAGSLYSGGTLRLQIAALLPAFVLMWALRRLSEPRLGAQLLSRAVWWSSLVVGLLISLNYGETPDKVLGAVIAVACTAALRSVGERGLEVQEPDSPFAPVRFRGHLMLALVMAAADALTLAFSGLLQLRFGMRGWTFGGTLDYAGPTVAAAIVMGVAVWGVYRLRTWALFLNLIANIAIAYLALEGTLGLSPSVSVSLATTAAIQCFIPVPILAAALGDRNAGQPLLHSLRYRLMNLTVLVLAAASVLAIGMPGGDGWVDGPGRAFIRGARPEPKERPGGYRCPDGTLTKGMTGCRGHRGRVEPGLRRTFTFAQTSTGEGRSCGRKGNLAVFFEQDGMLRHGKERYEQLAGGDFVSRFSRIRVLEDGRWQISSKLCGDNILLPADAETAEDPSSPQ